MAEVKYQVHRRWDNERVRRALRRARVSQRQIALELDVTVQTVSRVLAGKQSSLSIIRHCCNRTGLPIKEVIHAYVEQTVDLAA